MSIVEIEDALRKLSPEEVNELMNWFVKHHAEIWDKEITRDLKARRFNSILADF